MELELRLQSTRAADDFMSRFQFTYRETDAKFIFTAHLKGYKRENIRIDINEDGTLITISGKRKVKETVMVGCEAYKQETRPKGFKKVFRIPNCVILDEIKASYDEDESTLKITMPKKVIGIWGAKIEEIEEKLETFREGSSNLKAGEEIANCQNTETSDRENDGNAADKMPSFDNKTLEKEKHGNDRNIHDLKNREETDNKQETYEHDQNVHKIQSSVRDNENVGEVEDEDHKQHKKRYKMCVPIVAGSAFLLSLVVFVFRMVRSKNHISLKRD